MLTKEHTAMAKANTLRMLKADCRGAACRENDFLYELYVFRGHAFRVYPGGNIGKANEDDIHFINEGERRKQHA